jgi:nicotinamide-nucleotide adenylyltransferase
MTAKKDKVALFIGRFQPFHRGHLSALEDTLNKFDFTIVAIGSSDKFRTPENPFTVGERHAMVKHTLDELGIASKKYKVVPMPDIDDDVKWPKYVVSLCPPFETVISGNAKVAELFEKYAKKKIIKPKMKYRINATDVRDAIGRGESLEKYLHSAVIAFLQKIGAARRIIDVEEE